MKATADDFSVYSEFHPQVIAISKLLLIRLTSFNLTLDIYSFYLKNFNRELEY